jgi:hypothetical protein
MTIKPFDPNFVDATTAKSLPDGYWPAQFPSVTTLGRGPVTSAAEYAQIFTDAASGKSSFEQFCEGMAKSLQSAPSLSNFSKLSILPNQYAEDLLNWPGIPPELLVKIVDDSIFPKVIIQQRVADVLRYSERSSHPWKPGFAIELRSGYTAPTDAQKAQIVEAESFISNCAYGVRSARERDSYGYRPFRNFLASVVRDRFRFDFVTVYTDTDTQDRVQAFKAFPADRIRLATPKGYKGNKNIFACGIDDGGTVVKEFTRKELFTVVQNERSDAEWGGYGYTEVEQALRIIQGFTDAIDTTSDLFNKNAIPNGILMAEGFWGPRQLEVLSSIWANLKKGVSKNQALPVMSLPKDGGLEVLNLKDMKENASYFAPYLNLAAGLYCAISNFPVDRLGYFTSGGNSDSTPDPALASGTIVDNDDPGLAPLLNYIANFINEYLIWTRWPDLQFTFRGASPREDSRAYEARVQASTWGEARALADLMPLKDLAKGQEQKEIMAYMELCPVSPIQAAVYQNIITALIAGKNQVKAAEEKADGATMTNKIDPARSETHGGTSGVRRDSAKEKKKSLSTLYVSRSVDNAEDILAWATEQGIPNLYKPEDVHVTIAFSRAPVSWDAMGDAPEELNVPKGGFRQLAYLGDKGALVLKFTSASLTARWNQMCLNGASWDYEGYVPHITLSLRAPGIDLTKITPYKGPILLGAEVFGPVDEDWATGKSMLEDGLNWPRDKDNLEPPTEEEEPHSEIEELND